MSREEAAQRLRKAELELRAAQQLDGSLRATERYRAAVRELQLATAIAEVLLGKDDNGPQD